MNRSLESRPASSAPGLLSDIAAFLAIVSGFLFLSLTYRFDILEDLLEVSLKSKAHLVAIYLVYVAVIAALKAWSWLGGRKTGSNSVLEEEIARSLFAFHFIASFYLATAALGATVSLHFLGHTLIWTVAAEFNQLFCKLLSKSEVVGSLGLFGICVEVMVVAGQGVRLWGLNACDFL